MLPCSSSHSLYSLHRKRPSLFLYTQKLVVLSRLLMQIHACVLKNKPAGTCHASVLSNGRYAPWLAFQISSTVYRQISAQCCQACIL